VVVDLGNDVEGFIPMSELAARRIGKPDEVVQIGQSIEASIIEVRPRDRRIVLSLRQGEESHDRKSYETFVQRQKTSDRTTIGDLFGHLFKDFQGAAEEETSEPEKPHAEATAAPEAAAPEAAAPEAAPDTTETGETSPVGSESP
jgi:transcriptional accessory protein Tex/SPT6